MQLFELVPWANWDLMTPSPTTGSVSRKVGRIVAALASERVEDRFFRAIVSGLPEDLPLLGIVGSAGFRAACRSLLPWLEELPEGVVTVLMGKLAYATDVAVYTRGRKLAFVRLGPSEVFVIAEKPPPASGWLQWGETLMDDWYASDCWAHVVAFPEDEEIGEIRRAHVWLRRSRSGEMFEGHHGPVASVFPARTWTRATAQYAAPLGDFFIGVRDDEEAAEVADTVLRRDRSDPVGVMVAGGSLSKDAVRDLWKTGRIVVLAPGCGQTCCSVEVTGETGFRLEMDGELRDISSILLARGETGEVEIATTIRTVVRRLPSLLLVAEGDVRRVVNGGLGMYRPVLPV